MCNTAESCQPRDGSTKSLKKIRTDWSGVKKAALMEWAKLLVGHFSASLTVKRGGHIHEQWEPLRFTYKALSAVVLTAWGYCKLKISDIGQTKSCNLSLGILWMNALWQKLCGTHSMKQCRVSASLWWPVCPCVQRVLCSIFCHESRQCLPVAPSQYLSSQRYKDACSSHV